MKKIIAVLVMGVIIGIYCLSLRNAGQEKKVVSTSASVAEKLQTIAQELGESYPSTPKEVVEKHNELMRIGYSSDIQEEEFTAYAEALRMLYTNRLQEVNPIETQVSGLIAERLENEDKPLIMINNEIMDVTIIKDSKDSQNDSAEVTVKHGTNKGNITKKYSLIKEDGMWKIQSWETQKSEDDSTQSQTTSNNEEASVEE